MPAANLATRNAGWLLPAGLLFSLLLLGRWSQAPATLGPRGAAVRASRPTYSPPPTLASAVASAL